MDLKYASKKPLFKLSHTSFAMLFATAALVLILLPLCTGHLGSLAHNGKEREKKQDIIREIIYCNFVKLGEGKPPLLSHIRVSRGPLDEYGLMKSKGTSTGRMNLIKSPSYQHKMLHMSQFHNTNPSATAAIHQNPFHQHQRSQSLNQNDLNDNGLSNNLMYPVASVYLRNGAAGNGGRKTSFNANGELFSEDQQPDGGDYLYPIVSIGSEQDEYEQNEDPSFTPFIGARALSNMPKFFQHIRENLDALHLSQQLEDEEDNSTPREYIEEQKDLPERRGDYFISDGRLSINTDGLGYEYDNNNDKPAAEEPKLRRNSPNGQDGPTELDILMGRDPKYKKANNYNPSWLFTNLGLGKRSHL